MQYNLSVISLRSLTSHPQFEPEASLRLWLASFSSHRPFTPSGLPFPAAFLAH